MSEPPSCPAPLGCHLPLLAPTRVRSNWYSPQPRSQFLSKDSRTLARPRCLDLTLRMVFKKFPQTQRQQKEGGDSWCQIRSPAHWAPTPLGFSWNIGCLRRGQFRGSFAAGHPSRAGRTWAGWECARAATPQLRNPRAQLSLRNGCHVLSAGRFWAWV